MIFIMALSWSFSGATVVSPHVSPDGGIWKSDKSTISCTWSGAIASLPTKCLLTRRSTFILPGPAASVDVLFCLNQNAQDLQVTRKGRVAVFIKQSSSTALGPSRRRGRLLRASALPPLEENAAADDTKNDPQEDAGPSQWNGAIAVSEALPPEGATLLLSCVVGLATGISVVAFNKGVSALTLLRIASCELHSNESATCWFSPTANLSERCRSADPSLQHKRLTIGFLCRSSVSYFLCKLVSGWRSDDSENVFEHSSIPTQAT